MIYVLLGVCLILLANLAWICSKYMTSARENHLLRLKLNNRNQTIERLLDEIGGLKREVDALNSELELVTDDEEVMEARIASLELDLYSAHASLRLLLHQNLPTTRNSVRAALGLEPYEDKLINT